MKRRRRRSLQKIRRNYHRELDKASVAQYDSDITIQFYRRYDNSISGNIARALVKVLVQHGYNVTLVDSKRYAPRDLREHIYVGKTVIVQDDRSGRFKIIDAQDRHRILFTAKTAESKYCDQILKCQSPKFEDYDYKNQCMISAFTYFEHNSEAFQSKVHQYRDLYRQTEKSNQRMFFRGRVKPSFRKNTILNLGELLGPTDILPSKEYFDELSHSFMAFSIEGYGDLNHRDIECLGIGIPLIRPQIMNYMYNPLVPDYHYICVQKDNDPAKQAALIRQKHNEVKNDTGFLNFVSNNATEWYDFNVLFPNSAYLALHIMGVFDKVFSKRA